MPVFARFRALPDKDKAALIRKLVENGTPDFDFFFLVGLSTLMATLGLLMNSGAIVIASMLIAPLIYPILGVALGLVTMSSNVDFTRRALSTLTKSLGAGLLLSTIAALFFTGKDSTYLTVEVMARTDPSHLHLLVAIVAGAAAAYMMAKPEWGSALPGAAIAVALIPPLATVGIGVAHLDVEVIKGAVIILLLNLVGIIAVANIIFQLMNLGEKDNIVESAVKKEDEKVDNEHKAIQEMEEKIIVKREEQTVIKEDIIVK